MATIVITGHSDDLVEVDGALREEFSPTYGSDGCYLAFPNGALLRVVYSRDDDGIWRITQPAGEHPDVTVTPCPDPTGEESYTDRAEVEIDDELPVWVLFAEQESDGGRVLAREDSIRGRRV